MKSLHYILSAIIAALFLMASASAFASKPVPYWDKARCEGQDECALRFDSIPEGMQLTVEYVSLTMDADTEAEVSCRIYELDIIDGNHTSYAEHQFIVDSKPTVSTDSKSFVVSTPFLFFVRSGKELEIRCYAHNNCSHQIDGIGFITGYLADE